MRTEDNVTAPIAITRETPGAAAAPIVRSGLLLGALGVLTFSFTMPMTKIAVRGLDPVLVAFGRATVAAALAALVLRGRRAPLPSRAQWRGIAVVAGGVVVGFPILTAYALHHAPSAHGAVVTGLLPLLTAGCAALRVGERPSPAYWLCSAVGLTVVVAFAVHEGGGSLHAADVLLFGAVAAAALGYTEGAVLARSLGGWQVICWALVLAAPLMAVASAVVAARTGLTGPTLGQWAAFGYTSAFSMLLGFFAWYAGMARAGIARTSQLQLAQPALGIVWGWPLLDEHLTWASVATVAVLFGVVLVGRRAAVRAG